MALTSVSLSRLYASRNDPIPAILRRVPVCSYRSFLLHLGPREAIRWYTRSLTYVMAIWYVLHSVIQTS